MEDRDKNEKCKRNSNSFLCKRNRVGMIVRALIAVIIFILFFPFSIFFFSWLYNQIIETTRIEFLFFRFFFSDAAARGSYEGGENRVFKVISQSFWWG